MHVKPLCPALTFEIAQLGKKKNLENQKDSPFLRVRSVWASILLCEGGMYVVVRDIP